MLEGRVFGEGGVDKQVVGAGARGMGRGGGVEVEKEGMSKEGEVAVGEWGIKGERARYRRG